MIRLFKKVIDKFRKDHQHIIKWGIFRIYHGGSYAKWSFEFGRIGHGELVILIRCNDRFLKVRFYRSTNKIVKLILKQQGRSE